MPLRGTGSALVKPGAEGTAGGQQKEPAGFGGAPPPPSPPGGEGARGLGCESGGGLRLNPEDLLLQCLGCGPIAQPADS